MADGYAGKRFLLFVWKKGFPLPVGGGWCTFVDSFDTAGEVQSAIEEMKDTVDYPCIWQSVDVFDPMSFDASGHTETKSHAYAGKRFLLFLWDETHAGGGWFDFAGSFATFAEVSAAIHNSKFGVCQVIDAFDPENFDLKSRLAGAPRQWEN